MKPAPFDYVRASSLDEALRLLAAEAGEARALAGGQSLIPMLALRMAAPSLLVDITRLPDLGRIHVDPDGLRLGALVRWCDLERDPRVRTANPLLHAALAHIAHYQIRNRGTVGGSLAHADPAAELPLIAVTCGATLTLAKLGGRRKVAASEFFRGALDTDLAPDELITEIRFPVWPQGRHYAFREIARRKGDFAIAGIALCYDLDELGRARSVRIGAIGAADCPLRLSAAEAVLEGTTVDDAAVAAAVEVARGTVDPPHDIHASTSYRRALLGTLIERALRDAGRGCGRAQQ